MNFFLTLAGLLLPQLSFASTLDGHDLTTTWYGYLCLLIFVVAYLIVIFEEKLHLRKSKPVVIAAGLIWITIAIAMKNSSFEESVGVSIRHNFLEYTELFFFLLVAMTYINAIAERGVFKWLRDKLIIPSIKVCPKV